MLKKPSDHHAQSDWDKRGMLPDRLITLKHCKSSTNGFRLNKRALILEIYPVSDRKIVCEQMEGR